MAISTPQAILAASAGNANSGSANATVTTIAAGAGALVFLRVGNASSNNTLTAFSDSASNTWHIVQGNGGVNISNDAICWSILSNFMPVGTSFTASTTGGQWNFDGGWKVNGVNGGIDVTTTGNTGVNTTGISQATGTLATNAGELIIGNVGIIDVATYTESANFTNLFGAGAANNGGIGYRIVANNASITWAPTWTLAGNPNDWQLVSFKISAVGQADGVGAAPAIGVAGSSQPGVGVATGTGTAKAFALASGAGEADSISQAGAIGAAGTAVVGLAAGAGAALGTSTNTGVGLAAGIGAALAISGLQGIADGLAAGVGAAPGIGLGGISRKTGVVGWFDEWDEPPPPIRRQRLMAIQRVQHNNGWLNAGRIFKGLNKSTRRMRRDQNFRYEEDEDVRG